MNRRTAFYARYLLVFALIAAMCPAVLADPTAPNPGDRNIAFAVAALVKRQHLSRHPLDFQMSERCLTMFLKSLDPMKVYFYQSDIDQFNQSKDDLCDQIRKGDVSFAYTVFQTFLKRVDERVQTIDELLAMKHDFTVDENISFDRDKAQYPRDAAEAKDRWRKRIKYDLLMLKSDDKDKKEGKEAVEKLTRRYHSFDKRMHQVNGEDLLEMYLNAFTMSFDPHTDYMSNKSQENFEIAMRLDLEGIGASLMSEDGYTTIKKIIRGGAADKDGRLKLDDKIIGVGQGDEGEFVDTVDMKLSDVVDMIRGKRGTTVRLEVQPADGSEKKIIKIVREKVELKDSEAQGKVFDVGRKADGSPYRIGVIDLPSFYRDMAGERRGMQDFKSTTTDVRRILDDFNQQHVDAVVLDLRYNGGGALNEACTLTGLFIGEGPVVQIKDSDGRVKALDDLGAGVAWNGPLVVLISKFSASASEIFAGAIQDYGRGLIVGDHSTHGKGTVQSLLDLGQQLFRVPNSPPMGALKITMQQFYRPNGDSTQKRGVLADIELPSLTTHLDVGEADLDYPVEFDKVEPVSHKNFDFVRPVDLERMRALSQQRLQNSEKFQKVLRNIVRYKDQKAKKLVTLNEEKFLKERADLNADREEEKEIEKRTEPNSGGIVKDYYLDEALAIAADYLNIPNLAKAR
jgi:carboxyl-terminal processing protease